MKIPKSIKISGKTHSILISKTLQFKEDAWGLIRHKTLEIELEGNLVQEVLEETFIHEVIHGIDKSWSIGLKESEVDSLAKGIYSVLKENKLI